MNSKKPTSTLDHIVRTAHLLVKAIRPACSLSGCTRPADWTLRCGASFPIGPVRPLRDYLVGRLDMCHM